MNTKVVLAVLLAACLATSSMAATCKRADYACVNNTSFCLAGRVMACGAGTRCIAGGNKNRSPCIKARTCVGQPDYICFTSTSFCQAGQERKCAAGSVCRGNAPCTNP